MVWVLSLVLSLLVWVCMGVGVFVGGVCVCVFPQEVAKTVFPLYKYKSLFFAMFGSICFEATF